MIHLVKFANNGIDSISVHLLNVLTLVSDLVYKNEASRYNKWYSRKSLSLYILPICVVFHPKAKPRTLQRNRERKKSVRNAFTYVLTVSFNYFDQHHCNFVCLIVPQGLEFLSMFHFSRDAGSNSFALSNMKQLLILGVFVAKMVPY